MNCTAHIDKENGRGDPSPTKKGGSLEKPSPQVGRWVCEANSDEVEGEFAINTSKKGKKITKTKVFVYFLYLV